MSILEVKNLKTHFFTPFGLVKAVDGVSFDMKRGKALGLAGESGCGKTTIAYSIMRLIPSPGRIVEGNILFNGKDLAKLNDKELQAVRWKEISMVFQGAMASFNPLFTIGDQISEAILKHETVSKTEAMNRTYELLELVGIDKERAKNYPWELSGGMKQRSMVAMALSCNPTLLIADEPTTALDVIVSAQIMDLIKSLREKLDLTMLLITHDISVIAQTCDELAVMYGGKLVEKTDVSKIFTDSIHPYTTALINAFPSIIGPNQELFGIPGNPLDLMNPPLGCRFAPRCPKAQPICTTEDPVLSEIAPDHFVACHFWREIYDAR